jgi:hypothetical protein
MHQHSHRYGSRWPNASVRTGVDALTNVPESFMTAAAAEGRTPEPPGPGSALTPQMLADVTRANENIPTRRHPVKTKLEE